MKKIKNSIKKSFYYNKIKENKTIIIISLILSIICTLISYPGIWYSDSYGRVYFADTIIDCAKKVISGERLAINVESWLTVIPSLFMGICKFLTGNIAFYTFIQSFLFIFITMLLIKKFTSNIYIYTYSI